LAIIEYGEGLEIAGVDAYCFQRWNIAQIIRQMFVSSFEELLAEHICPSIPEILQAKSF
jgi:hypothetical protein